MFDHICFNHRRNAARPLLVGVLMLSATSALASQGPPIPQGKPDAIVKTFAPGETPIPTPKANVPPSAQQALVLHNNAPAKVYFGAMEGPAPLKARSIGSYAKGCLAGGAALPVDGPSWQAMRLSRNRNWGHPELIDYLKDLADAAPSLGWRGLLVGDLAQPRGGPMTSGHASHQIGLDADIWLTQMPDKRLTREEREEVSAVSMLKGPLDVKGADRSVDPKKWTDIHARLIRRAAQDKRVARIFVNPTIKKALCSFETGPDRAWLRKVRPWWGHHYHFHVRLACPKDSRGCQNQNPPPPGDGCGSNLTYWLSDEPWVPKEPRDANKPIVKKRPMALAALPNDCRDVLEAN